MAYTKDFSVEPGAVSVKISEEVAKRFSEGTLKVEIYQINREVPTEETLKERLFIDISCCL